MWAYIVRKLLIYVPVYLSVILVLMALLRVRDPIYAYMGKNADEVEKQQLREAMGLDKPLFIDIGVWRAPWKRQNGGHSGMYLRKGGSFAGGYTARWTAQLEPGTYTVSMTWPNRGDGNPAVSVYVLDGPVWLDKFKVNQQYEVEEGDEEGVEVESQVWHEFGEFEFGSGAGTLQITNSSTESGFVLADSVRFTGEDGTSIVLGVTDPGFETEGRHWTFGRFASSLISNQYYTFLWSVFTLDFSEESWSQRGRTVGDILKRSIPPSLSITVPTLAASAMIGIVIALTSAYFRGQMIDRLLMTLAVLGMSVSYVVYIIFGQFLGAFLPNNVEGAIPTPFQITGYKPWVPFLTEGASLGNWVAYCMLPVIIGVIVAVGYDTRFYRAVMVEESARDYIVTAMAKGATKRKIMFVHMLKNAMIPIITRVMATLPFMVTGSVLLEMYFRIPGMGFNLISALLASDFPVIQAFVAVLAAIFIVSIILTDVLYALVDPRVRLS